MPTKTTTTTSDSWLVVDGVPGLTIAPSGTQLTRLHYFDGKFLRASDLELEQNAQRALVHLSNQAGGFGVVYGFDTRLLAGDLLAVGAGQAIDAAGQVLLLPGEYQATITDLIARSQQIAGSTSTETAPATDKASESFCDCGSSTPAPAPGAITTTDNLWLITIGHAEFLCGEEDVYGKLCEAACVGSTERPFRIEGVVLRARPLTLLTALVSSQAVTMTGTHLRSRVASAYFADERGRPASLISGTGLRSKAWCMGADLANGEVALGVLCRQGASNLWFDSWTARRERMDGPPRDYWAHRMAMRPWREYLAQILQFQCQLAGLLCDLVSGAGEASDPCADARSTIVGARDAIDSLLEQWAKAGIEQAGQIGALTVETLAKLRDQFALDGDAKPSKAGTLGQQILIDGGIIELPPAGYLPVDPNSQVTVNEQVRRLLGEGVDLRFCVIRPDDAGREIESAQHMDRISLLRGLDDPSKLPPVDILVPDGRIVEQQSKVDGLSFRAKLGSGVLPDQFHPLNAEKGVDLASSFMSAFKDLIGISQVRLRGAGRVARTLGGGGEAFIAALLQPKGMVSLDVDKLEMALIAPKVMNVVEAKYMYNAPVDAKEYVYDEEKGNIAVEPEGEQDGMPQSMGVWFDMSTNADPFTVAPGQPFEVRFLLRAAADQMSIRYQLFGSFKVDQRKAINTSLFAGVEVIGTFEGVEIAQGMGNTNATQDSSYEVILIRSSGDQQGVAVLAKPIKALFDNDVFVAWDGQSLDVAGAWFFRELGEVGQKYLYNKLNQGFSAPPRFVAAGLAEDAGVRSPIDPDHIGALKALQLIADRIDDPSFAEQAANKLFPPPPDPSGLLTLEAIHDWVVFQARHRRQCAPTPTAIVPLPVLRYSVFNLEVKSADEEGLIIEALKKDGELLDKYEFREVGSIEFNGGIPSLRTSKTVIATLWKPYGEDRQLDHAAIASIGAAADGFEIERLRLVERIVAKISPKNVEFGDGTLAKVPHVFEIGEGNGAIVLLTRAIEQKPFNASLYWAAAYAQDNLKDSQGTLDYLLQISEATQLAELEFVPDQSEPTQYTELQQWNVVSPLSLFVLTRKGDIDLPPEEMLGKQAGAAASRAGIDASNVELVFRQFADADWKGDKGRVVIVVCSEQGWPSGE